jgi:hypothetical protein
MAEMKQFDRLRAMRSYREGADSGSSQARSSKRRVGKKIEMIAEEDA